MLQKPSPTVPWKEQKVDFPGRDDENFLKHSLAYQNDTEPRMDYKDVVITKWPPGERVYGKEE